MDIFGKVKGVFSRKKNDLTVPKEDIGPDLEALPMTRPEIDPLRSREPTPPREQFGPMESISRLPEENKVDISNVRAKLDLLLTEMDSLKTQNQMISERLKAIEKILADMRGIRYY
ncbi:MAG: hypothetical protein NTW30_00670 [Candidatus Aenigmarchaeota archaeon]|nr:hypothetical protein [Candidatus Aenigmarchaeota archaeon]